MTNYELLKQLTKFNSLKEVLVLDGKCERGIKNVDFKDGKVTIELEPYTKEQIQRLNDILADRIMSYW